MRGGSSRHEYAVLDRGSACLQCKRRKKRCDGTKPVCGPCVRFGTADQCEFPRPPTPKLKPKPSPPRSKSEALRMQIRELEDQLATLQKAVRAKGGVVGTSSTSTSHLAPPQQQDDYEYDQDQRDDYDMDDDLDGPPFPKVESPLQHTASPDLMERAGPALSDDLLRIFLLHRRRCAFECDEGRFVAQFRAPPDSSDAMHPGLISAVYLLGYHFASMSTPSSPADLNISGGRLDPALEAHFLQRTREHLAKSLTAADRLGDFLRGTALLVWYFFAKGRIAEAQYHASGVSCFASACRLHLLSHPSLADMGQPPILNQSTPSASPSLSHRTAPFHQQPTQIIAPAKSQVELEERISLFWTIFVLDRYASLICGTNPSIQDETIWTSWPRDSNEWESTRTEMHYTMLSPPSPQTLFPVLDYSTSGSDSSKTTIPRNNLSFRALSALLLERSTHLAKATAPGANQQALLQRNYDTPHLQRSLDATKAAARKIGRWLAPTPASLLLRQVPLSGSSPIAHVGVVGRAQAGISPQVFQTTSTSAEEATLRSSVHPAAPIFPQHPQRTSSSSSLPASPHHHHSGGVGGFGFQSGFGVHGGDERLDDPSEIAALLLAHSALNATWIRLDAATRSLAGDVSITSSSLLTQPVAIQQPQRQPLINSGSAHVEYYRPPPTHSQPGTSQRRPTSPSTQIPSRPTSASDMYHQSRHQQHLSRSQGSHVTVPPHQYPNHQQSHASIPLSSLAMPNESISTVPAIGAGLTTDPSSWDAWNTHDNGLGNAPIPPWISPSVTSSPAGVQYTNSYPQQPSHHPSPHAHYSVNVLQLAPPLAETPYTQASPPDPRSAEMGPLAAAREIAELASVALGLPFVFDELDMLIGSTWTAALQVLSDEIRRWERIVPKNRSTNSASRHNSPPTQEAPSQLHLQQQQSYHYQNASHYASHSPIEHPSTPTHPSYLGGNPVGGDSDGVVTLAAIRDQRDILVHALDRLSGMFQLVGACSSISNSSSSPTIPCSHRRTTSCSSITSTSSSTSGAVSDRMVTLMPYGMQAVANGAEFVGGFEFGVGGSEIFKSETDSYGSSSLRRDAQPYFSVLSGYEGERDLAYSAQMTPPVGRSPFGSSLGNVTFHDGGQLGLDYLSVAGPTHSEIYAC